MIVSYYTPDPPGDTEKYESCYKPDMAHKVNVTPEVSILVRTFTPNRVALDDLYVQIADNSIVSFESNTITVRSRELIEPLLLKIEPGRVVNGSVPATDPIAGPAKLQVPVTQPPPGLRPNEIVIELPRIRVNSDVHELAPLTYRMERHPRLAWACF